MDGNPATECTDCDAGSVAGEGGAFCTKSLPGSFANVSGLGASFPCPDGEYQDEAGQTECKPCDAVAGSNELTGSLGCNPCPPGSIVSGNGTCTLCHAGTISNGGSATNCTKCTTGSSERGKSYCDDCKAGTYLNADNDPPTCDPCDAGEVSKAAASACTPCEQGRNV